MIVQVPHELLVPDGEAEVSHCTSDPWLCSYDSHLLISIQGILLRLRDVLWNH